MQIQVMAEFLSATAAVFTVGIASVELYSRSNLKKAEEAADAYAEYLYVKQQLEYSSHNINRLVNSIDRLTPDEVRSFAKTHVLDADFVKKVQKIENISVKTFNGGKDKGKIRSEQILDLVGRTINLFASVNTFLVSIAEGEEIVPERIKANAQRVQKEYEDLMGPLAIAEEVLKANLVHFRGKSFSYVVLLVAMAAMLISFSIIISK